MTTLDELFGEINTRLLAKSTDLEERMAAPLTQLRTDLDIPKARLGPCRLHADGHEGIRGLRRVGCTRHHRTEGLPVVNLMV